MIRFAAVCRESAQQPVQGAPAHSQKRRTRPRQAGPRRCCEGVPTSGAVRCARASWSAIDSPPGRPPFRAWSRCPAGGRCRVSRKAIRRRRRIIAPRSPPTCTTEYRMSSGDSRSIADSIRADAASARCCAALDPNDVRSTASVRFHAVTFAGAWIGHQGLSRMQCGGVWAGGVCAPAGMSAAHHRRHNSKRKAHLLRKLIRPPAPSLTSPSAARCSETRRGRSTCRPARESAPPDDSAGNSSARRDGAALQHLARDLDRRLGTGRSCPLLAGRAGSWECSTLSRLRAGCFGWYQSVVHSQTLPIMSCSP